jgi:VWFA-related protein
MNRVYPRVLTIALALALNAGSAATTAAQAAPQQTPAFRSSVDLVPVDVSVIASDGKPVTGLTATDFTLTVDGRPRRIASAEFLSAAPDAKAVAKRPASATYSTNADTGGRLIMLVVDQSSIGPGRGRAAMESAIRFLSQLSPADRVGLMTIPPSSSQIEFTREHSLVAQALPRLVGQAETFPTQYRIGVSEATAVHQGDPSQLTKILERECAANRQSEELEMCRTRVASDVSGIADLVRERTQQTLGALRSLLDRLAQTQAAKTVVLVSEGLVVERVSDVAWLGPAAAKSQTTIQVLHLESPTADASVAREPISPGRDRALGRDGLELIAGVTRGSVFPVASSADNAFARLALELSGYYLLSFEPEAADRDGKLHKIKVAVPGRAGEIRSRSEFAIEYKRARTDDEVMADIVRSPLPATDIGLKLNAFSMKDAETGKVRVLMVVEIDRAANPDGHVRLGYVLTDGDGRAVASEIDRDVKAPIQSNKTQIYTVFMLSDRQGPHTLKVAVLDDVGRKGSVEHNFTAGLTTLGELRAADLLLAEGVENGGPVIPSIGGEFTSGVVNTYIELYSDVVETLKSMTVMFEVSANEDGRAMDGAVGRVKQSTTESPDRRALEASFKTTLLPPGDYVVRAVVSANGKQVGRVTRPLRIGKTVSASAKPNSVGLRAGARPVVVPFSSRIERFDRASVLTPQVVGFFMERMDFPSRGESSPSAAIEHARSGRFDEALGALRSKSGTVPSAFMSGLALYSKGELEPAAAKFREALRMDSEFFPAAFYLGSCYAAGGRDEQAVGAWQLSLVTQSDAAFIFTLLGDALLRLRDAAQALEVLNEAAAQWPEDEEVQVRLGAAYAMSGKRAEALVKLEPYLDAHPQDHERHLIALRTLYEAHAAGAPIRSKEDDRALFTRWATAYSAAKGPQVALVEQWQRALSR